MFVPTGNTPLDILIRLANVITSACKGLIDFFNTPLLEGIEGMAEVPPFDILYEAIEGLVYGLFGNDITWIELVFISIPVILTYNFIKWIVGIITGS